jgi:hypothetical protein
MSSHLCKILFLPPNFFLKFDYFFWHFSKMSYSRHSRYDYDDDQYVDHRTHMRTHAVAGGAAYSSASSSCPPTVHRERGLFDELGPDPMQRADSHMFAAHGRGHTGASSALPPISLAEAKALRDATRPNWQAPKHIDATSTTSTPVPNESDVAAKPDRGRRDYNWFLTYYPTDDPPSLLSIDDDDVVYYITQLEKCPTTNRIHGHMYIEFKQKKSMTSIKKLFNDNTINCQIRKGSQQQAIAYCSKVESRLDPSIEPTIYGSPKHAGARNDLDSMCRMAMEGASKSELLFTFGGNAFRHLGMIDRVHRAILGFDKIENNIIMRQHTQEKTNAQRATRNMAPLRIWEVNDLYVSKDPDSEREATTLRNNLLNNLLDVAEETDKFPLGLPSQNEDIPQAPLQIDDDDSMEEVEDHNDDDDPNTY